MITKKFLRSVSLPKLFSVLLISFVISIPVSFNLFKTFSSDITVSLNDLVNNTSDANEENDGNPVPFAELEEVESEIPVVHSDFSHVLILSDYQIFHRLITFISTYVFSIFIPPSL